MPIIFKTIAFALYYLVELLWTAIGVFLAYLINGLMADKIGRRTLINVWSGLYPIAVILVVMGVNSMIL